MRCLAGSGRGDGGLFFAVLDGYTLADIIERRHGFHRLILSLAPADRGSAAGLS
ncbi:hypothetical protein ACFSKM_26115 [Ancylobacter dichloromethanicus]